MRRSRPGIRPLIALTLIAVVLGLPGGCGQRQVEMGTYRAVLTLPGGELPFGLELTRESRMPVAYLINGPERVRVSDVKLKGSRVEMRMPAFGNRLDAERVRGGLKGEVVLVKRDGKEQRIPFAAELGSTHRFFEEPTSDNADVSGRWAVTFIEPDGKRKPAVAEFQQSYHEVTGTFLLNTGDHRYLAGEMRDDELYLSAFEGSHAFLYHAKVASDGGLEGKFWSGLAWVEDWSAQRDESAALPDADTITRIQDDTWSFGFTFPDHTGRQVALADERFRRKVVVVMLAGSWCPNCHDETAFLAPFYREFRDRGVEAVALMFEHFGDFERAAAAVSEYRSKFNIEFPTLIAGISDKDDASTRLPQLSGVVAFPTTLFIDRLGKVRRIHTGFSGPATGVHHEQLIASFRTTVESLLAEGGN
jgi:thiol-disulfide isomerase/thioredoxin